MLKTASHLLIYILILTFAVFAQGTEPVIDEHVCNDDFAMSLVDQQVAESRSVAETDKRVRILTKSADFLWKFEQPRAREYFTEAYKVATDRFKEKGFEKNEDQGITSLLPDYRFEVVSAIANHDSRWAQRLTEELLKEYEKTTGERKSIDKNREIDAVANLAVEVSGSDRALSLYLFRRLIREPLDFHWLWAIYGVHRKDAQFAAMLYEEALRSYSNATPRRLLHLSAFPFGRDRVFGYDSTSYSVTVPEDFSPNVQSQVMFVDTFLRRADSFASDPNNFGLTPEEYRQNEAVYIVSALNDIEPIVVQTFPQFFTRIQLARAKAFAMLSDKDKNAMGERDKWRSSLNRSFEVRIEELEKADEEGKLTDAMIAQTLITPPRTEEQFRLMQPWIDKITEAEGRAESWVYFWFIRGKLAVKEKRFADAKEMAARIPEVEQRAILMFEVAEKELSDVNEAAAAYQTLADVAKLARISGNSIGKARVHLGLANLYEKFNHGFAISELSDAITTVNKVKGTALLASSIQRRVKVKDLMFFTSYSVPGFNFEETFSALSKTDFSLPLSNARTIDDKYYRTLAVIAIAKNCITAPGRNPTGRAGAPGPKSD